MERFESRFSDLESSIDEQEELEDVGYDGDEDDLLMEEDYDAVEARAIFEDFDIEDLLIAPGRLYNLYCDEF